MLHFAWVMEANQSLWTCGNRILEIMGPKSRGSASGNDKSIEQYSVYSAEGECFSFLD